MTAPVWVIKTRPIGVKKLSRPIVTRITTDGLVCNHLAFGFSWPGGRKTNCFPPAADVVSGSALLVDYVLTITISVASGADQYAIPGSFGIVFIFTCFLYQELPVKNISPIKNDSRSVFYPAMLLK